MSSSEVLVSNSAGFGGIGPAISSSRLLLTPDGSVCACMSAAVIVDLTSKLVIPCRWSSISKSSANRGLRMSKPTKMTFLPSSANDTAKLAAVNVLPSPEMLEVNEITFSPSLSMN